MEPEGLAVVTVQELIKEPMVSVPERYILSKQNNPNILKYCAEGSFPTPPTISLERLVSVDTAELELEKLHASFQEWGLFQLVNHGVRSSMEKLKHEIEEFYKLPLEEKMKYRRRPGEAEGYGSIAGSDGKFDWGDRFYMITNPIHMRKPYLLPLFPSSLRNALETYLQEMEKLGMKLFGRYIAKALKMDLKKAKDMVDDAMQSVRITYVAPCPQPDSVVGMIPHSDASLITIVNQINGVHGLQIKKDGAWLPVNFQPDALVVNVGDVLEILSNGIYKSVEHYVTVNPERERMSIAFFFSPNLKAEVGPATCLMNPNPPRYRRVGMNQYVNGFFSRSLNSKSYLDYMKICPNDEANNTRN